MMTIQNLLSTCFGIINLFSANNVLGFDTFYDYLQYSYEYTYRKARTCAMRWGRASRRCKSVLILVTILFKENTYKMLETPLLQVKQIC